MSDDDIKQAEKRGYAKGYNAGMMRKVRAIHADQLRRREDAFWQRAFLAALPACIAAEGWTQGGEPIISRVGRTKLAAGFADDALRALRDKRGIL